MFVDFVINSGGGLSAGGPVGDVLQGCRFDPGLMRPYIDNEGQKCVTVNTGRRVSNGSEYDGQPIYAKAYINDLMARNIYSPVFNATTLRKEQWIELDKQVLRAARSRLQAWQDLALANSFGGFNGMAKTILEHETMSDGHEAVVDMDGLTPSRGDRPLFQLEGLPLPITHSDFYYSQRQLAASKNDGMGLDTTSGEQAGRKVAEMIEKTLIGTETGITYGGNSTQVGGYGRTSKVYGYTNFSSRLTKTNLTTPTGSNAASTLDDVLAMRQSLYNNKFYGPFMVYHSTDWDTYMDDDYTLTGGNVTTQTLRERLKSINGVTDVKRLDFLTSSTNPFTLIMVQMTPEVCRAVNGMDVTTVQWESSGGLRLNFKVMCIQVPQLRADYHGNAGILHATTS